MAKVRVRGFTVIRDIFQSEVVEVDVPRPETVKELFAALLRRYGSPLKEIICDPKSGELSSFPVRLNDEMLTSVRDGDRRVSNGDELTIIFPIGGGC
ncbi:MAG TPA: MoaD/ThiS family protein [Chloroflexota bacterium]|nr:MoaD/ThiS family protein [Chloroflexota bacterium]